MGDVLLLQIHPVGVALFVLECQLNFFIQIFSFLSLKKTSLSSAVWSGIVMKELGKLDILNKSTKILRYFDGQKQETFVPFYQVLTTHVARKSFITNALMLGVPERIVREVSGHKDEKSFRRYVKLVDSYKDEVIRGAFEGVNLNN